MSRTATITLVLPLAEELAQFLKRMTLDDYRAKAVGHAPGEADAMQRAGERLRPASRQ